MRSLCRLSFCIIILGAVALSQSSPISLPSQNTGFVPAIRALQGAPNTQGKLLDNYGRLPLRFEANEGQTDARVRFLSRMSGFTLFLTGDEAVLAMRGRKTITRQQLADPSYLSSAGAVESKDGSVLRMKFRGANPASKVTGMQQLAGMTNYFVGNDRAKWHSNIPTYAQVKYEKVYPGIDLVYYGSQR